MFLLRLIDDLLEALGLTSFRELDELNSQLQKGE